MLLTTIVITENRQHLQTISSELSGKDTDIVHFENSKCNTIDLLKPSPQMIIIDCCQANMEMLITCRELRHGDYTGLLIVITDRLDKSYQLFTLNLGVDAVLTWKDGQSLVLANIQALFNRFTVNGSTEVLQFGNLTIDKTRRDAFLAGNPIHLSTMEFRIIWFLAQFSGEVVSRNKIHHGIYNQPYNGYDRSIDLYISRIRQKIGDTPTDQNYVKTVRGVGYQFVHFASSQHTDHRDTN